MSLEALDISWSPLPLFHSIRGRNFLSTLWQVEAATVALVLAGSLFAFEALTRQRADLPLSEYASRSGLSQYFMLAASGLITIPVVLLSSSDIPAASASLFASFVGLAGLAALPFFFAQAMNVVNPDWLQNARTNDLDRRMREAVDSDATSRVSSQILNRWANENDVGVGYLFGLTNPQVIEESSAVSDVLDIDLQRAAKLAREHPGQLNILVGIGERVSEGAALLAVTGEASVRHQRPVVTTSKRAEGDPIESLVQALHGEATEAIERGSVRAAETVAALYTELWLEWPRKWQELYGQRLQGGLLSSHDPFRLGPTSKLKRNLRRQLELAVDRGLRDHVQATLGIVWSVGLGSVRVGALDLVSEMYVLARSFLTVRSSQYPELIDYAIDSSRRFQIRVCEYAARNIEGESTEDRNDLGHSLELASSCFRGIIESLKVLLDIGRYREFGLFDKRLMEVLRYSRWEENRFYDELTLEDATSSDEAVAAAKLRLQVADSVTELMTIRDAGRLSLLGWAVRSPETLADEGLVVPVRSVAQTLGSPEEIMAAAGRALDYGGNFMSDWVMASLPEGEAHFVDANGPVLRGLAVGLLAQPNITRLPGSGWMTEDRVERFQTIVDEVADWTHFWDREGETLQAVSERADKLKKLIRAAEGERRHQETLDLIDQPLDPKKVELFRDTLVTAWVENRVVEAFTQLAGVELGQAPAEGWGGQRFGFNPSVEPKGLFVTPSNWGGLDHHAKELGRTLAREEVGTMVRLAVEHGTEVDTPGEIAAKLQALLDMTRADGFQPGLILTPIHWRLSDALGLRSDPPRPVRGPLGRNLVGRFDDVPVVQWWEVPDDHVYVIDAKRLWDVVDGVEEDSEPSSPSVEIGLIDEDRARQIVSGWEPADGEEAEEARILDLRTKVERRVFRPYRVEVKTAGASWYVTFEEPRKHPPKGPPSEESHDSISVGGRTP